MSWGGLVSEDTRNWLSCRRVSFPRLIPHSGSTPSAQASLNPAGGWIFEYGGKGVGGHLGGAVVAGLHAGGAGVAVAGPALPRGPHFCCWIREDQQPPSREGDALGPRAPRADRLVISPYPPQPTPPPVPPTRLSRSLCHFQIRPPLQHVDPPGQHDPERRTHFSHRRVQRAPVRSGQPQRRGSLASLRMLRALGQPVAAQGAPGGGALLPRQRGGRGRVLVTGGYIAGAYSRSVCAYDPARRVAGRPALGTPRGWHCAVALGGACS